MFALLQHWDQRKEKAKACMVSLAIVMHLGKLIFPMEAEDFPGRMKLTESGLMMQGNEMVDNQCAVVLTL
jgi:hypothetical protein